MHTADLIDRSLLLFRGGDGQAYLNELYVLDVGKGRRGPEIFDVLID
jgi:hypothetical protein